MLLTSNIRQRFCCCCCCMLLFYWWVPIAVQGLLLFSKKLLNKTIILCCIFFNKLHAIGNIEHLILAHYHLLPQCSCATLWWVLLLSCKATALLLSTRKANLHCYFVFIPVQTLCFLQWNKFAILISIVQSNHLGSFV